MLTYPELPPELPSATVTRLATLSWAGVFRVDAFGTASPAGKTVRYVPADPETAVTLRTTAVALEGTVVPVYPGGV